MPDKSTVCTISFLGGVNKRFEKTRSRMVYHAIWGLGEITPTSRIVSNDITMPRLPRLSKRSEKGCWRTKTTTSSMRWQKYYSFTYGALHKDSIHSLRWMA